MCLTCQGQVRIKIILIVNFRWVYCCVRIFFLDSYDCKESLKSFWILDQWYCCHLNSKSTVNLASLFFSGILGFYCLSNFCLSNLLFLVFFEKVFCSEELLIVHSHKQFHKENFFFLNFSVVWVPFLKIHHSYQVGQIFLSKFNLNLIFFY